MENEPHRSRRGLRVLWLGLAIMFVLIGIAIVILVLATLQHIPTGYSGVRLLIGLLWLLVILWVISLIFRAFSYSRRYYRYQRRNWQNYDSAFRIVRERYASGEISKEQYEQIMQDLKFRKE
jgi:uncharacterized membrane protein